tara:strand:- start:119 stop:478 length:360 start_codon:yes stop_codon:yes gene_type:complete
MKSIALALATISFASTPAMAGIYLNAESNASYSGNDYQSRATDLHVGYEGDVGQLGYYVQGGPTLSNGDGVDGNTEYSGKLGGSIAASEKLDVYGEISVATVEDADKNFGTKVGAKFKF